MTESFLCWLAKFKIYHLDLQESLLTFILEQQQEEFF